MMLPCTRGIINTVSQIPRSTTHHVTKGRPVIVLANTSHQKRQMQSIPTVSCNTPSASSSSPGPRHQRTQKEQLIQPLDGVSRFPQMVSKLPNKLSRIQYRLYATSHGAEQSSEQSRGSFQKTCEAPSSEAPSIQQSITRSCSRYTSQLSNQAWQLNTQQPLNSNGFGIRCHTKYFSSSSRNLWLYQTIIHDTRSYSLLGAGILGIPTISSTPFNRLTRRDISTKRRRKFKVKKMHYRKAIKKARYLSTIPQYEGVIGQIKKRPLMKEHVGTPRLRLFKRER